MRIIAIAAATVALGTLAACGQGRDEPAAEAQGLAEIPAEEAGAAPAAAPPGTLAAPQGRLKAGLWRVSMTTDGQTMTSRMCVDAAVQSRMSVIGAQGAAGACQETSITPAPDGFRTRAVCDSSATGGGLTVTEGHVTGDLDSAYVNRMSATSTGFPVAHMNRKTEMVAEGRYEGACPAGMKPGDIEMPGGLRLNMEKMAEGAARAGR